MNNNLYKKLKFKKKSCKYLLKYNMYFNNTNIISFN